MKNVKGFTLIELMIVVAIVAILAAVALPIYQDYVARSQVSEGMAGAGAMKTSITEFYIAQGAFPQKGVYDEPGANATTTVAGRYTKSVQHDAAGNILVTMQNVAPVNTRVRGDTFQLRPIITGGAAGVGQITDWNCSALGSGNGTLEDKYLPSGCQATVAAP